MKSFVKALVMLAALPAVAFNSVEWLEKRAFLSLEAERLKSAYATYAAKVSGPAENVSIPVEMFEDGSIKTVVTAKKAQYFLNEGFVWAEGVQARKFKPDGSVDAQLDADNCIIDRNTKSGWCEGKATISHGSTVFSGVGVYFSSPEAYVKVTKSSEVVSKDLKFGGLAK